MLCIALERSGVGQVKEWFVMCQNIAQLGTSLVVQWLRICLLTQVTWVWSLVWGDPTCHRAAKLVRHSYGAAVLQLLKLAHLEPKLCNIRSRCSEDSVHGNQRKSSCSKEGPAQPKKKKKYWPARSSSGYRLVIRSALIAQLVKNLPAMQETLVWFLGWEGPLEKGKATHFSIQAWRIPCTIQSMGLQRVGVTFAFTFCSLVRLSRKSYGDKYTTGQDHFSLLLSLIFFLVREALS